jgi:hypothetical protein
MWRNIRYRWGVYYKQTNLQFGNNAVMDYGLGLGLGVPIKVSNTIANFTLNIGQLTTSDPNTLKELYLNFHVALSLGDIWFVKHKFN